MRPSTRSCCIFSASCSLGIYVSRWPKEESNLWLHHVKVMCCPYTIRPPCAKEGLHLQPPRCKRGVLLVELSALRVTTNVLLLFKCFGVSSVNPSPVVERRGFVMLTTYTLLMEQTPQETDEESISNFVVLKKAFGRAFYDDYRRTTITILTTERVPEPYSGVTFVVPIRYNLELRHLSSRPLGIFQDFSDLAQGIDTAAILMFVDVHQRVVRLVS